MNATISRRAWVEQIMGMPISVHLRGAAVDGSAAVAAVAAAFAELRRVDALFSTYRADSQISRLNRGELGLADCDPLVREVARLCALAKVRTGGFFDVVLPLPTDGRPVHAAAGADRWYDPSGLVKGWAAERAATLVRTALPDHDLCLNAGGDVTVSLVTDAPPWRVGVEDPARPGRILEVLTLTDGAVATSGPAHRGAHIVNPRTGGAATGLRAVTVTGPSLCWADVYATAAVARGPDAFSWLAALDGYAALAVDASGAVHRTSTLAGRA